MLLHTYQAVILTIIGTAVGIPIAFIEWPQGICILLLWAVLLAVVAWDSTFECHTRSLKSRILPATRVRINKLTDPRFTSGEEVKSSDHKSMQVTEADNRTVITICDGLFHPTCVAPVAEMFEDYSKDYIVYKQIHTDATTLLNENYDADSYYIDAWNKAVKESHETMTRVTVMLNIIRAHPRFDSEYQRSQLSRQTNALEKAVESAKNTASSANTMALMSIIRR